MCAGVVLRTSRGHRKPRTPGEAFIHCPRQENLRVATEFPSFVTATCTRPVRIGTEAPARRQSGPDERQAGFGASVAAMLSGEEPARIGTIRRRRGILIMVDVRHFCPLVRTVRRDRTWGTWPAPSRPERGLLTALETPSKIAPCIPQVCPVFRRMCSRFPRVR